MKKSRKWKLAQKLEQKWWRNYLKGKSPEEYLKWKKNYWNEMLAKISDVVSISPLSSGEGLGVRRILDAGCGPAGMYIVLEGHQVDAVDPLLSVYETDLPHFKRTMYPEVHFFQQPLEEFSTEKKYDLIFCQNALNHVNDLDFCLSKLFSLMNENARFILCVDGHRFSLLKYLFRLIPGDALHPHQYSTEDYRKKIFANGGKILKEFSLKKELVFDYRLFVIGK